jgi:hypothetical protein
VRRRGDRRNVRQRGLAEPDVGQLGPG